MKKTPVDFLKLRVQALLLGKIKQSEMDMIQHWYEKAKDMEREEMESAYEEGFHAGGSIAQLGNLAERYYEETFTKE
jgi:hypothetical protein